MIKLYSNNCPKCNILKQQLEDANIEFEVTNDFKPVIAKGLRTAPVLEVDNEMMMFNDALKFIIEKRGN